MPNLREKPVLAPDQNLATTLMQPSALARALLSLAALLAALVAQPVQAAGMNAAAYEAACGSCHEAYPPLVLPSASWNKIVPLSGEHFGQSLPLTGEELTAVRAYLTDRAAEFSQNKRARKIMESLGEAAPLHFSDVPYLVRKHRKIPAEVFLRPAVGGLRNCAACHPGAAQGEYKDDFVRIPR